MSVLRKVNERNEIAMQEFIYTITDAAGIHARPAGMLVKAAKTFTSAITVTKDEKSADLKRLFAGMGMGVKQGESITVRVEGADEEKAAAALKAFLQEHL